MVGKDPAHARDHDWLVAVASRPATTSSTAGSSRRGDLPRRPQARLLLLARIPDRPPAVRRARTSGCTESRARRCGARRRLRPAARARARRGARQRRARPARRVLHGEHGDARRSPRMATAFATTTASSARCCATAGSTSCRRTGCPPAIPGSSSGPRSLRVGFGGTRRERSTAPTAGRAIWHPAETVDAVAFDTPIAGWRGRHVNTLRLWSARATDPLRLDDFNRGDHVGALAERVRLEAISRVLYPSDETPPARSCGCGRSSSSPRRRCRTSFAGTRRSTASSRRCPTTSRSSSTTRIRRSPSPN